MIGTVAEQGRPYGGVSAADRRADRRRRLLDAGLELFGTRGVSDVTVGDVCAEAGLTKRYFYAEFAALDDFIDAVIDDVVELLAARTFDERGADAPEWPRSRVASFVGAITEDPRLARLVLVETFGAGGSLAGLRQTLVHRAVELMIADFVPAGTEISREGERLIRMAGFALSGASAELIVAWLQGDIDATADDIIDYLVGLFSQTTKLTHGARRR